MRGVVGTSRSDIFFYFRHLFFYFFFSICLNLYLRLLFSHYVFMNHLSFKLSELVPPPGSLSPSPSGKLKAEEDNFAATAPIISGEESTIEINKDKMGLGLNIVGGSDTPMGAVVVNEIYPDGAAFKDRRLKPGDQILEINNEDFRNITNNKALSVLRQTPSKVRMVVYREDVPEGKEGIANLDIIEVELTKKSGKGLGLSIVGRKVGAGIFVSDFVSRRLVLPNLQNNQSPHHWC
ncbi:unnamed protein product [Nezara viridula]|uniref:PDZ domain-containing protein n=1 Tax=Nezara viridula TaxID=85310 RepID=A0A9P0E6H6_NEZVI|nr:unnamed protein product [Nezara viridula]